MSDEQHIKDTMYLQWKDSMYVMLEDLERDYEKALIEDSLRDSVYFKSPCVFGIDNYECNLGVHFNTAGLWQSYGECATKLTRAQALYIATGETNI